MGHQAFSLLLIYIDESPNLNRSIDQLLILLVLLILLIDQGPNGLRTPAPRFAAISPYDRNRLTLFMGSFRRDESVDHFQIGCML